MSNKNSHSSPKLSIVCLSYERQRFLRRQLLYFADRPVHLIFADGSKEAWTLGNNGSIGAMRWTYFHIPGPNTYPERWQRATRLVTSDYVCMMDDADVMVWSGLARAISFLDANPNCVYAGGRVGRFVRRKEGWRFFNYEHWTSLYSLNSSSSTQRLLDILSNRRTANLFYVVIRSDTFKYLVDITAQTRYYYNPASELIWSGSLAICSPYQIGNYPFWLRGDEPSVSGTISASVKRTEWTELTHPQELATFKRVLSTELEQQGVNPTEALEAIQKYLDEHLEQCRKAEQLVSKEKPRKKRQEISLVEVKYLLHPTRRVLGKFTSLFNLNSNRVRLYKAIARYFENQNNLDNALAAYSKVIELEPDFISIYLKIAELYELQNKSSLDEDNNLANYVSTILRIKSIPVLPLVLIHSKLGELYELQNRKEESILHYQKSLSLQPDNEEAQANLSRILEAQKTEKKRQLQEQAKQQAREKIRTYQPGSLSIYWQITCDRDLSPEERNDLANIQDLLNQYPKGIETEEEFHEAIKSLL